MSARQADLCARLAASQTVKAIAMEWQVSAKTVEYHRARLYAKLKVNDLAGVTRFALANRLLTPAGQPARPPAPAPPRHD